MLFLPLVFTSALTVRYLVDIPVQDEWSLVEDISKASAGTWGLQDLVRSHNGHRFVVTRLILVGSALATDWRADFPAYLGPLFAAGILAFCWPLLRKSQDDLSRVLAAAFLGGLVASPNQWENWLWGIQMHVFLAVLISIASLRLVAAGPLRTKRVAWGAVLALLACATQGAGLVLWPVGALVLAARGALRKERMGFALAAAWGLLGTLTIVAYLAHLPGDAGAGAPSAWVFRHPVAALRFVGSVIGHSLVAWDGAAFPPHDGGLAAVVAMGAFILGLPLAIRALRSTDPDAALFPLALIVWSTGVSAQISLGRASWGIAGALASRYVTLMLPFWIGFAALVFGYAAASRRVVLCALCGLVAVSAASDVRRFPERNRLLEPARRALLTGESRELVGRLHPEIFQVDAALPTVKRLRLSVFRAGEPTPIATSLPLADPRQRLGSASAPEVLAPGERRRISISLANVGKEGWSSTGDGVARGWVSLGTRWFDSRGNSVSEGPRRRLARDLAPGASLEAEVTMVAPDVPSGSYRVEISALQEGVAWFPEPLVYSIAVKP